MKQCAGSNTLDWWGRAYGREPSGKKARSGFMWRAVIGQYQRFASSNGFASFHLCAPLKDCRILAYLDVPRNSTGNGGSPVQYISLWILLGREETHVKIDSF